MTIIKDWTFANYKYKPQLGYYAPSVFYVSPTRSVFITYSPLTQPPTLLITYLPLTCSACLVHWERCHGWLAGTAADSMEASHDEMIHGCFHE